MRVPVTGGLGYIGRAVTLRLAEAGNKVASLACKPAGRAAQPATAADTLRQSVPPQPDVGLIAGEFRTTASDMVALTPTSTPLRY